MKELGQIRTCDEAAAGSKVVGHEAEHEVSVCVVKAVWFDVVVEPLWYQAHSCVFVEHDSTALLEIVWLQHVVTVHDHEDVLP